MQKQAAAKRICIQLKYIKITTYLSEPAHWSPLCSYFRTKRNTCQLILPINDRECLYCAWQNSWQLVLPTYSKIRRDKCNFPVLLTKYQNNSVKCLDILQLALVVWRMTQLSEVNSYLIKLNLSFTSNTLRNYGPIYLKDMLINIATTC
jgi:hypothetical protein